MSNPPQNPNPSEEIQESATPGIPGHEVDAAKILQRDLDRRRNSVEKITPKRAPFAQVSQRLLRANPEADARAAAAKEADRQKQLEAKRKCWESMLGGRTITHGEALLENFRIDPKWPAEAKSLAARVLEASYEYAGQLDEMVAMGRGILLLGSKGTGKDHILVSLARAAIFKFGIRVTWHNGPDLAAKFRNRMNDSDALIKKLIDPKVLYISDAIPQQGALTSIVADSYHRVIDARISRGKPTWVSLNAADQKQANELMGGPIVDRLGCNALVMHCRWPSERRPWKLVI